MFNVKIIDCCDMMPRSVTENYQHFGRTYCLHLQSAIIFIMRAKNLTCVRNDTHITPEKKSYVGMEFLYLTCGYSQCNAVSSVEW
jgi:hypothetical protein